MLMRFRVHPNDLYRAEDYLTEDPDAPSVEVVSLQGVIGHLREAAGDDGAHGFSPALAEAADFLEGKGEPIRRHLRDSNPYPPR